VRYLACWAVVAAVISAGCFKVFSATRAMLWEKIKTWRWAAWAPWPVPCLAAAADP